MIRYSVESDINNIITLWEEAFGDSKEEIMFFINNKYKQENTLVYETDGKIASMLFLLEGEMRINGNIYPSYYLYAACTLNEYRGRGYMSLLLEFAEKTAFERGVYFICLLPASKSLYDYYEKFGYKSIFKKKIVKIISKQLSDNGEIISTDSFNLFELREKAFKNIDMFVWDNKSLDFAFEHHKLYGGQAIVNCKGYALYTANDRFIDVKEMCFTDVFGISNKYKNINLNLPVEIPFDSNDYEIVDSGMILPIYDESEKLIFKMNNPYLGLTLD